MPILLQVFTKPCVSPPMLFTLSSPHPYPPGAPNPRAATSGFTLPNAKGRCLLARMNGAPDVAQCTTCAAVQSSLIQTAFTVPTSYLRPPSGLSLISHQIPLQVFVSNPDGSPASKVLVSCTDVKVHTTPSGEATLVINTDANLKELTIQVPHLWGRDSGAGVL